jgi:Flp pilus assembly protein TadD
MSDCHRKLFHSVCSAESTMSVGWGSTKSKSTSTSYYFVKEEEDGTFTVQALNDNHVPMGETTSLSKQELMRDYSPEPAVYVEKVIPALRALSRAIARGERHRAEGQFNSAEYEFLGALNLDEDNVRATFGLGLTYMDSGETDKAHQVFEKLVGMDAAFTAEHKHMFNEFGISLRKSGLLDQARDYYARALELSPLDENLHYNMARTLFLLGDRAGTKTHLARALELNPDFKEARQFLAGLERKIQV